jgi:hypothetical protein
MEQSVDAAAEYHMFLMSRQADVMSEQTCPEAIRGETH